MNKYIVVTEKSQEIVYAEMVEWSDTKGMFFSIIRPPIGEGLQPAIKDVVAAFKVYEYFLLDDDDEDVAEPEESESLRDKHKKEREIILSRLYVEPKKSPQSTRLPPT